MAKEETNLREIFYASGIKERATYLMLRYTGATLGSGTWTRPWPARRGRRGRTRRWPATSKETTSRGGEGPCWQRSHRSSSPQGSLGSDIVRRTRPWWDRAGHEEQNTSAKWFRSIFRRFPICTWTSAEWWSQLPIMKQVREMARWWGSGSNSVPPVFILRETVCWEHIVTHREDVCWEHIEKHRGLPWGF